MKPSLWLGLFPCVRMPREKKQGEGGADIFPRLFLSPEEEDEDGVMSEVPFVRQHESLSSSFRYTLFFFFPLQNLVSFIPSSSSRKEKKKKKSRYRYV